MSGLIYGLVTGVIFGFLLQKAQVIRYDKQIGALRLLDLTIVKFMLSSVLVAMVGVYLLKDLGLVRLSVKSFNLGGVLIGGLLFGLGWGLLGYCPGTSLGALGEGRWDSLFGIGGMLAGAALYAEAYPGMKSTILAWADYGKITLPQVLGVSPWLIIALFWLLAMAMFAWFERRGL